MKVLVLNCGSSSLKYQFIEMENESVLAKGVCERIGQEGSFLTHKATDKETFKITTKMNNHTEAIKFVMEALSDKDHGVINSIEEISAVGHRVVHGGENFSSSVIINEDVKEAIKEGSLLAPLHNPPNLIGIEACEKLIPNVIQVAVFDTAFHQTMPEKAFMYAIPYELYEKHKFRKYGFHGTSHKYVAQRTAEILNKDIKDLKIVTCHLGNGASICAVDGGISVDTSMGLTPLEGLVMGTRSGDVDPALLEFLMKEENLTIGEVEDILNKKSGVLGLSGVSSDFRDIEDEAAKGHKRAQIALDVFYYRVIKYVGQYVAAMDGIDALVFTAGLGENSKELREIVSNSLTYLGVEIDNELNNMRGLERVISTLNSKVAVLAIPTNEELVIARDTKALLG